MMILFSFSPSRRALARRLMAASMLALCSATLAHRDAKAAEAATVPYLKGYKDFYSGVVPAEPGLYISDAEIFYTGDINKTVIGGRVSLGLHEDLVANAFSPTVVTSYKFLGGTYAFNVSIPIAYVYGSANVSGFNASHSKTDSVFNIGDITLTPVILAWDAGNFHWNVAMSVIAPTGEYQKGALAFTGLNYWTFLPQAALTWFNPATGWNVSGAVAYSINTENHATNYQSGDDFDLDWAVGKQVSRAWNIGLVGYYMQQVTGDSGSGAVLGANEASVWALGPGVSYGTLVGHLPMSFIAKWTHEIQATRTFGGDTVTVATSFKF